MGSDCIRIFGLYSGSGTLRAMMKIRSRDANRLPGLKRHWGGFGVFPRRSDRFVISSNRKCDSRCGDKFSRPSQADVWGRASKGLPDFQTAQAMRDSLLATAMAALLWPQRCSSSSAQARNRSGLE